MVNQLILKNINLSFILLLMVACSGKTLVESDLGISGAPDWVNEGTQILKDKDGRLFHGVGFAQLMNDESLQIATADNRARAEIARTLSSYMNVVFNDYTASASAGEEQLNEQDVSRQIKNVTQLNLTGAKIIAHWRHPKNNAIYTLAELDMKYVKSTLDRTEKMNSQLRDFLRSEADNVFDRMAKEKP